MTCTDCKRPGLDSSNYFWALIIMFMKGWSVIGVARLRQGEHYTDAKKTINLNTSIFMCVSFSHRDDGSTW